MSPITPRTTITTALAASLVLGAAPAMAQVEGATVIAHQTVTPGLQQALPTAPALTWVVQPGETLGQIAARTGTALPTIAGANGLGSNGAVRVGQVLAIPAPTRLIAAAAAPSRVHVVSKGDTLYSLARQYGTTVMAIMEANGLNSTLIPVGRQLTIPGAAASAPQAAPGGTYTIRTGDTLSGIARRNGTTVAALMQANGLKSTVIYAGRQLKLPGGSTAAPATSAPATSGPATLVSNTFLHYTYPQATVDAANVNKAALLAAPVPSRNQMREMVRSTALSMGVNPALAMAIAFKESGFNHTAVSPANAIGTMQVIPSSGEWAAKMVGRPLNVLDPQDNVTAGVAIIRQLVRSQPSLDVAIGSYYQGAGSIARNGMYADTKSYVAGVKSLMAQFG